jgi:SAM-dependent methyltransferase
MLHQGARMVNPGTHPKSSSAFFETKYQKKEDPWNFAKNAYELQRYDQIISAISHQRYHRAFEPGCSVGVLTELLAERCDAVDAFDFSPSACRQAQRRCAHLPHVNVVCASISERSPSPDSDLLILSEIGYYFNPTQWEHILADLVAPMRSGTTVLAAHWLGHSRDHCISGNEVHRIITANSELRLDYSEGDQNLRLDRFVRL